VLSGVLDGARLEGESVIVDVTGTATVDLGPTFMDLPREDQSLVLAQLETMLVKGGVSGASAVRFLVQGVPITVPVEDSLMRDPAPDGNLVALGEDGSLVALTAAGLEPVEGVAALEGITARSPAQGIGGFPLVLLSGSRRLVNVRAEAVSEPWVEGRRLVDPSVDLFGWVWTTP